MMLVSQMDVILGVDSAATRSAGSTLAQLAVLAERLGDVASGASGARGDGDGGGDAGGALVAAGAGSAYLVSRWPSSRPASSHFMSARSGRSAGPCRRLWGSHGVRKDVLTVLPSAFGLAFVSSVNILITSRVVEHFRGRHKRAKTSDADAELGAYGIANICAAMFGAPLSVGIPARSLAVVRCGGSTRVANLVHAAVLGVILWLGSGVVSHIPLPALAGVTAWMGLCLLDWSAWRRLPKMSRTDAAAFLATAVSVLAVERGAGGRHRMRGVRSEIRVRAVGASGVEGSGFAGGLVVGGTGLPACL